MREPTFTKTPLAAGVALALGVTTAAPVSAQQGEVIEEVVTVGIRGSLKASMDLKRGAKGVVDAISAEDIPAALASLKKGIADADAALEDQPPHDEEEGEERPVSLHNRAVPLIEMLEAAQREDVPVMWE